MAPAECPPTFQKLRLNTRSSPKPIPSTFASIKRNDGEHPGSPFPELGDEYWGHDDSAVALTNSELADDALRADAPGLYSPPPNAWQSRSASYQHDQYALPSRPRQTASLEQSFRDRHTSISFAPKVTLDSGNHIPMDEPLPRPDSYVSLKEAKSGARADHAVEDGHDGQDHEAVHIRNNSETDKARYDPHTGELMETQQRRIPYRTGQSRHPLLQETVDDLANDAELEDADRVASLTSGTTVSTNDGSLTPLDSSVDYLQSPLVASSPIEFPSMQSSGYFPGSRRTSSVRSRSFYSEKGSLRRNGRRTSTRSGHSSMSPASAFLSQWGREEASSVIEPDDEGQEIPDHSGYFIGKQIGFGGFSVVKEVSTIQDGVKIIRAVKIVRKQVPGKNETENDKLQAEFEHEVEIWRYLKHPYILPLLTVYDSPFATFCITKLNSGGTLFDIVRTSRKSGKTLPSHIAKRYLYQLASALRYLHEDVHVVHRDVKLENCLVDMSGSDASTEGGNVLLCDFGMADFITNENRNLPSPLEQPAYNNVGPSDTSTCIHGSLEYAAPELIHASMPLYSPAVDIWAYGVVAYTLLTGNRPFHHNFQPALVMLITKGEWDEEALREAGADEDAIEFIRGCLEMDPDLRWTIADVLECSWFEGCSELYEDVRTEWVDPN